MMKIRIVIVLMVGLLILSSMAVVTIAPSPKITQGSVLRSDDNAYINNTFVIDQNTIDPITGEKGKYGFDSNVIVNGKLIVKNATLYFLSDTSHIYHLIVNGNITLYNATLTVSTDVIDPSYTLHVKINGTYSGTKIVIDKSRMLFNGWFNITNKEGCVWINNTVFDKVSGAPASYAYGPTPFINNSTVRFINTSFMNLFEHVSSGNGDAGTMTNSTGVTVTSADTDKTLENFIPTAPYGYEYWYLPPLKGVEAEVTYYNSSGNNYDGTSNITVIYNDTANNKQYQLFKIKLLPSTSSKTITQTNDSVSLLNLTPEEMWKAYENKNLWIYVSHPQAGSVTVQSVRLHFLIEKNFIIYGLHRFDFTIRDNSTVYAKDLHVDADFESAADWGTTHNRITLLEGSKLYVLNLTVNSQATTKLDSCIYTNDTSEAYILRYANINVTFNGYAVPNVYVNATPYLLNADLENTVVKIINNFVNNISYDAAVDLVNRSVSQLTSTDGQVYLPLLSDIINYNELPNSKFVGIYNITVNRSDTNSYNPLYTAQIGLDHYPNLLPSNNTFVYHAVLDKYKDIDIQVSIVKITPKPYITNHELNVTVNVTNAGSEIAENITVILYVNGNKVTEQNISNLQATPPNWVNIILSAPATVFSTPGVYNITVEAEQKWDINLSNNKATNFTQVGDIYVETWNVGKLVRLHNTTIVFTVYSSYDVHNVNISLWIENSSYRYLINYSIMDLYTGTDQIAFGWNNIDIPYGEYNLIVYANTTAIGKKLVYVYKDVDLVPSFTIITQSPYLVNGPITIRVNIHNSGSEAALDAYFIVYVNGMIANRSGTFDLSGHNNYIEDVTLPPSFFSTPGKYNITVVIFDYLDYNSSNNMTWQIITVGNVYVDSWSIEKLVRNHTAAVSVKIYSSYAIHNTNVYLYIDSVGNVLSVWHNLNAGINILTYYWYVNGTIGSRTFYVYINGTLLGSKTETVYEDVDVSVNDIYTSPSTVYQHEIIHVISSVSNIGSDPAKSINIEVDIYNPLNERIYHNLFPYYGYGAMDIDVQIQPNYVGIYTVNVTVLGSEDWNTNNNFMSVQFTVNSNPYIPTLEMGTGEYENGTDIVISYNIYSKIYASMNVTLYVNELKMALQPINMANPISINKNGEVNVSFKITQSQYLNLLKNSVSVRVHFWISIESNRTGKNIILNYTIYSFTLNEKPDFTVVPGSFYVIKEDKKVSKAAEGVKVQLHFTVKNIGGSAANITYEIKDNNSTISSGMIAMLTPSAMYNVTYNYTLQGVGIHTFEIILNSNRNVSERSYSNDKVKLTFRVIPPVMDIYYSVSSKEHGSIIYEGDHVVITVTVINENATKSQGRNIYLSGVLVTVKFGSQSKNVYTNSAGVAEVIFVVNKVGTYSITINVQYHGESKVVTPGTQYRVKPKPFEIPWLWIIIAAIAGGVGGFFAYGYLSFKREAKEYMVCGNCGRLVPADAEKCPYCGAVFEKEKVKCPECGSWIDADAKYCPVCGTVFMSEEDPEYEKQVSLKERYEQYLTKYKEEAKKYIGEEYTVEEFFNWWKTHPEYISFQDWIKRQEEEIVGETVQCPVCGSLNPKGAKICRVCGSPLPVEEGEKEEAEISEEVPSEKTEEKITEEEKVEEEKAAKEEKKFAGKELEKITQPGVVSYEEWAAKRSEEKPETVEEKKEEEKEEVEEGFIKCPVCGALNPKDAKVCSVCGAPLISEEKKKEEKKKKAPPRPVVKRKVIKKVIPVKKEEEKE